MAPFTIFKGHGRETAVQTSGLNAAPPSLPSNSYSSGFAAGTSPIKTAAPALVAPSTHLTQTISHGHPISHTHSRAGSASETGTMAAAQRGLRSMSPALERDRSDALWAQMQATLGEVELSASSGTHVFGRDHDRKLAELRAAQIALAQAWARSEADDAIETSKDKEAKMPLSGLGDAEGGKSIGSGAQRPSTSGGPNDRLGAKLQEETEVDMLLARKRREANDVYFDRVNRGVLDVVAKLSDVATAMSAVECESRGIWNDGDSMQEAK